SAGRGLEGILSIERGVLDLEVTVAKDEAAAGARHDVDGSARRATVFGGQSVVHNLIFLDVLGRQLGAARPRKFIVVVEPIDRDIVASRAQPPEAEAAVRKDRARACSASLRRTCDAGQQARKIQGIATEYWQ